MEFVEIVRHLVRKHKEVGEQSGVGRFEGRMEARKERKGVPDDQKLSTNGGFWTLPLYGHQLSPLFCPLIQTIPALMANLPNLRRLFVEARTEAEENEYSRKAFYNLVLFISSVAIFSLTAQRMSGPKAGR
ncbi:uncharacterized protein N7525_008840 [Penicillium rubens]|uniref:uncharacterized protein n=1 Tax=Penicillium rubens TaxID=1108849 RepID=UPI002A5A6BEF|nr:uncharacterized protein N7525_008840 [Penicillium rubens]KAJ5830587.1 hypothetical protein N7525_008840 [Penicillium rubens]